MSIISLEVLSAGP